jgi:cytosine/adenosine deaminase-related metal-dependent hydrolase
MKYRPTNKKNNTMRKISADILYPVNAAPIEQGVVVLDDNGKVLATGTRDQYDASELELHKGALIPGFINTHCHLELSHMIGKVDTGTGLIDFIKGVVSKRGVEQEIINEAIEKAEAEMLAGGIMAVGDISNVPDTFLQKSKGNLRYYTFIEFFDFLQTQNAQTEFDKYKAVYDQLQLTNGSKKSCVPHAPYSVSEKLFALINEVNKGEVATVSIHNQETPPENELFLKGTGGFVDFYGQFGISLAEFKANGQTAIHYALAQMDAKHRTLFVHNTLTTVEDIRVAQNWNPKVYWATCPNANLYIENNLPMYQNFLDTDAKVTIGTDSLTSNWQLSILEEMKSIARFQSYVPFETILQWATLNGAEALGFEADLGSIEVGKTPGILLLSNANAGEGLLGNGAQVKRLV